MKPISLPQEFYIRNRQRAIHQLHQSSIAVFHSNYQMPTNADGTLPYVQNNDLLYLTGIDQEDTTLLLFPDALNSKLKEILFIRYADEHVLTWEGHKLSKAEAKNISGIETIFWHSEFEKIFKSIVYDAATIYLNANEHKRAENFVKNKEDHFISWCKEHFPLHTLQRLAPIMHQLRSIKQIEEINAIETACSITKKGVERIAKFIKPGVWEYEIEAELAHEFIRNGSKGFAYQPIIASGKDSCVLHYITNNKQCQDGDLVLLDIAAEFNNYKSDLTRVLPVNGKFTPRQKEVYLAVLSMLKYAKQILKPGLEFVEYNKLIGQKAEEELIKLKLLKLDDVKQQDEAKPLFRKYFMHGISHFLGLDVHDVGTMTGSLKEGMLITCEPGIYIKEENIGIRLENDILITSTGNLDLMDNIPIELEDIEMLMKR